MKTLFATLALALTGAAMSIGTRAQEAEKGNNSSSADKKKSAEAVVHAFVKAGDERNSLVLEKIMHENFRALAHPPRTTAAKVVVESREHYLSLIKEGKVGGKTRTASIRSVDVWNNTAIVRAELESSELHFSSTFSLFFAPENGWQLVHDLVELESRGK
jgi:hypothetical protein